MATPNSPDDEFAETSRMLARSTGSASALKPFKHRPADTGGTAPPSLRNMEEKFPTLSSVSVPLVKLAAPLSCANMFNAALPFISVVYTGHLGVTEVAASGAATMIANVTGYSLGIGLLTAMDTLTSQAYGAKNFRRVGIVFQRAMFILAVLAIPVASLWWYIKPILLALDQPVEVCDKATRYARFLTLGLVPYFGFEALRRFLQAQGIAKPMLIVSIIASVCHPIVNYIFIYRFALGYDGAPLAVITSQWVMFLSLLLYTVIRRPHTPETWGGFDREALTELGTYLKLAIPGAAMLLAEWWAFEVIGIGIGMLGALPLATHGTILVCMIVTYRMPLGIAIAVNVMIGNLLGAGDHKSAKRVAVFSLLFQFCLSLCYGGATILLRHQIPKIFTSDPVAIAHMADTLIVTALFMVVDGFQCIGQGIFRGTGKQLYGALCALVGYYPVGLPIAFALGFKAKMGLTGMYLGDCFGYIVVGILSALTVARMDWAAAATKAMALAQSKPPAHPCAEYEDDSPPVVAPADSDSDGGVELMSVHVGGKIDVSVDEDCDDEDAPLVLQ